MRPCPKDSPDFRTQQCHEFNGKHFGLPDIPEDVKWVPKYAGSECLPEDEFQIRLHELN